MPASPGTSQSKTPLNSSNAKSHQPSKRGTNRAKKQQQATVSNGDVSEGEIVTDGDASTPSLEEILQSLANRFIYSLRGEELATPELINAQVEKAHRVYEENIRSQNRSLPSLPLAKFAELFLRQSTLSQPKLPPVAQPPEKQETVSLWDIVEKLRAAPEALGRPAQDQDANTLAVAQDLGETISSYGKPKPQKQSQPRQAGPKQKRNPGDSAKESASESVSQSEPPRTPETPPVMQPAKQSQRRGGKPRRDPDEHDDLMEKMNGMMMKDEDKQALLDNRADRFNMLTNNPATQLAQNSKKGGEYGYEGGGGSNQAPPLIVANVNAYVYVEAKINANVTINICAPATKPAEPPKWAE
jgi:hypothetical protein